MPSRRAAWVTWTAVSVLLTAICLVLSLASWLGLGRSPVVADLLPARGALTAVVLVGAAAAGLCCARSRLRPGAIPLLAGMLVVLVVNVPILAARGIGARQPAPAAGGQLRILEWNTNGSLVRPARIAALAVATRANVIVLPDAEIAATAVGYRSAFAAAGLPVQIFNAPDPGAQTAVLIAAPYASRYRLNGLGPDRDKSIELVPTAAGLPRIVALHAPQPAPAAMSHWTSVISWARSQCNPGPAILAGDFNASIDSLTPLPTGCSDAAVTRHAGSVGTWPARLPDTLGLPIDHVLLNAAAGRLESFSVLTTEDHSGARHRPTLTVLGLPGRQH